VLAESVNQFVLFFKKNDGVQSFVVSF
jgi:hypothetical protein